MEYVLSLSYGKDSLACLGAIAQLGWPLDKVITADVWATETIPAELPSMIEFKEKADQKILERWGIKVEHLRSKFTYNDLFYKKYSEQSSKCGQIYGFPKARGNWCNGYLKKDVLYQSKFKKNIEYIGIALDEGSRFHSLSRTRISPLVEIGWTEADCRQWCSENDLLAPTYEIGLRDGCWFCYNKTVEQLRDLYHNYPEYWSMMLKWDKDSPVPFHANGKTVHDFDMRFHLEDEGKVPGDRRFKWCMLEENASS